MERKLRLCFNCNAALYDGENHICKTFGKSHFISKPRVGNKNAEGIHGSICNVQYNSVGQRQRLNYPAAFSNSNKVEMQLRPENLQNVGDNSYVNVQQGEHRVSSTSEQKETLDSSLQPSQPATLRGNAENRIAYDWMSCVPSHSSETREETINYVNIPAVSELAQELKQFSGELNTATSMILHYTLRQVSYEQESLPGSNEKNYAMTGVCNRDLLLKTKYCKSESYGDMDKRNILYSSNIHADNRNSKSIGFLPVQRDGDGNKAPQLPSLLQVNSRTCDIRRNNLIDNDVPLISGSDEYHMAGPSHRNVEAYSELEDGRLLCPLCDKIFNATEYLLVHYRLHPGEKPFACEKCPERFIEKKKIDCSL